MYYYINRKSFYPPILKPLYIMNLDGTEGGLKEDEYEASVATLQSLAATLEADCVLLRQIKADHGLTGQYLVRRRLDRQDFLEIRFV